MNCSMPSRPATTTSWRRNWAMLLQVVFHCQLAERGAFDFERVARPHRG